MGALTDMKDELETLSAEAIKRTLSMEPEDLAAIKHQDNVAMFWAALCLPKPKQEIGIDATVKGEFDLSPRSLEILARLKVAKGKDDDQD